MGNILTTAKDRNIVGQGTTSRLRKTKEAYMYSTQGKIAIASGTNEKITYDRMINWSSSILQVGEILFGFDMRKLFPRHYYFVSKFYALDIPSGKSKVLSSIKHDRSGIYLI